MKAKRDTAIVFRHIGRDRAHGPGGGAGDGRARPRRGAAARRQQDARLWRRARRGDDRRRGDGGKGAAGVLAVDRRRYAAAAALTPSRIRRKATRECAEGRWRCSSNRWAGNRRSSSWAVDMSGGPCCTSLAGWDSAPSSVMTDRNSPRLRRCPRPIRRSPARWGRSPAV